VVGVDWNPEGANPLSGLPALTVLEQDVALVLDQVTVAVLPWMMLLGLTTTLTVGCAV
jgi:hypothetical protein